MKNKLLKSVATLIIIMMVAMICNVSFASSVTSDSIKASLEKCLRQEIIIRSSDNSSTTTYGAADSSLEITDSVIGGTEEGVHYTLYNYSVADNYCTFDTNIADFYKLLKVDTTKASKEDLATYNAVIALSTYMVMEELYISTSDCVGKDLSLAYTYLEQQVENLNSSEERININIVNDVFSLIIKDNGNNVLETATLKINLDNLANLDESKIDKNKTTYKVFLGELPDSEKENIVAEYKLEAIANKAYTGKAIKPSVKLLYKEFETEATLEEGKDYTVSYSNNVNPGKAKVTVTGKRFYKGTITKTFVIVPKKVTGVTNKKQGKTDITVKWDKAVGATGYELEKYDTSKKKYVTVTKKEIQTNSFKVTGLKAATTYKFRVRAYVTVDGKKKYGDYSKVVKLTTKTATPTISKLTAGKKKVTVSFKKVTGAEGYQVQYSTDKNFEKDVKTANVSKSKTSKTISSLKSNKKYYVRIRTYRVANEKKVWSSYSLVKTVKTK